MKKIIIFALIFALSAVVLMGCEKEDAAPDAETESAVATDDATAPEVTETSPVADDTTDEPETTEALPDETFAPIENLEPITGEISSENIGTNYSSKAYKYLKSKLFTKNDENYNWYEFYNACVAGEINVASEEASEYIAECLEGFADYELTEEAAQANALSEAAAALAN